MTEFSFRPAASFTDRHGLFVALVGGTNSGKTYSALRLARGIAGPKGKIAVVDTEGGRTLHLKDDFTFDVLMMDAPHRPQRYATVAKSAEDAGYDALVIDSFTAEWAGMGGVLQWRDEEAQRMAKGDAAALERMAGAAWIKPKSSHKAMVYSFLERRIPIIFSIRGEESFKPPSEKFFKAVCNKSFLFEVTVSFRLAADKKGIIDLSDPSSWKMEGAHRDIFNDGEQLSEKHGEALAKWAAGVSVAFDITDLQRAGITAASDGVSAFTTWWNSPSVKPHREHLRPHLAEFQKAAKDADARRVAGETEDERPFGDEGGDAGGTVTTIGAGSTADTQTDTTDAFWSAASYEIAPELRGKGGKNWPAWVEAFAHRWDSAPSEDARLKLREDCAKWFDHAAIGIPARWPEIKRRLDGKLAA